MLVNPPSRPSSPKISFHYLFQTALLLLGMSFFTFLVQPAHSAPAVSQVTLSWRANPEPNIAGYRIYYGTESGNYTQLMVMGKMNSATVRGLLVGQTYYFAVTACDAKGYEGEYSNEVSKTVGQENNALNILKTGTGSGAVTGSGIDCGNSCQEQYGPGTVVTLTASPDANSSFGGWSGGGCSGTAPCTVPMNSNRSVVALFNRGITPGLIYKITVSASAGGTVSPSGIVNVTPGSNPTFTFTADPGYFVSDVKVDSLSQGGLNSYGFPNVQADRRLEVIFSQVENNKFTLNISKAGSGEGRVVHNPAGTVYNAGTEVALSAEAAEGSVFVGWSGVCSGTSPSCTVLMSENRSVAANFNKSGGGGSASREYANTFKADFNGDGQTDILWHHQTRGEVFVWYMDGAKFLGDEHIRTVADDLNWKVVGVGDLNGDGKPDILWHHQTRGDVYVWYMNGKEYTRDQYIRTVEDTGWKIVGIGDFNGDGKADILWHHQTRGELYVWTMDGATFVSDQYIRTAEDTNWMVVGVGDFNGDGKPDILWQHRARGEVYVWFMDGATFVRDQHIRTIHDDLNWKIEGLGDFDGDGKVDILWRHQVRGDVYVWFMDGGTFVRDQYIRSVNRVADDLNWKIVN